MNSKKFRNLSIIFAFGYALAGLVLFSDLFLMFLMGYTVKFQEPNFLIALIELISSIVSIVIIVGFIVRYARQPSLDSYF